MLAHTGAGVTGWGVHDQGHAGRHFKPVHLVPKAPIAQHVTVVAREHDDGVVGQFAFPQGFKQLADLGVHIAARTKVGTPRAADRLVAQRLVPQVDHLEQALGVRVLLGLRQGVLRHRDVFIPVQVVKLGGNGVGVVGVRHRDRQTKRLIGVVAHVVVQVLARPEDGFFVVVELVGAHAGASLQDRGHVVVPARAHLQFVPVDRPAVVGGVNVAGHALFVAVQLIGATKVHLARQRGSVTEVAQVVGVGGHVGGEVGRVVVALDARWQLATDQAEARRRAQGAGAIGRLKHHTFLRQATQMRHVHHRCGVVHRQDGRGHLVGHDEQDMGTSGRHGVCGAV